jgi:hypothetical protein
MTMATTPRGYRYPTSADDVRPYEDIQFAATDIDTDVTNLDVGPAGASNPATTSGSDSTTSATHVNMAGPGAVVSYSFTKKRAGTRIKHSMAGGWSAVTSTTLIRVAMNCNGVDTDCTRAVLAAGASGQFVGWGYQTGVPAGTYTITARWRREGGGGTASRSTNDWLAIESEEVP